MTIQDQAVQDLPDRADADAVMTVRGLTMSYGAGASLNPILADLDLDIGAGEFVSIVGPSGVGKTTLLP